ncbi:MAG: hypothetical protein SFU99_02565, partial [Saprospiraceae bacterium]|nr:hypothetical protein [Saprospiraceae bacterium]
AHRTYSDMLKDRKTLQQILATFSTLYTQGKTVIDATAGGCNSYELQGETTNNESEMPKKGGDKISSNIVSNNF